MIISRFTQKQTRSLSRVAICFAMVICMSVPIFSASAQKIPYPDLSGEIVNSFSYFKQTHINWAKEKPQSRRVIFVLTTNTVNITSTGTRQHQALYAHGLLKFSDMILMGNPLRARDGIKGSATLLSNRDQWDETHICGGQSWYPDANDESSVYPFYPNPGKEVSVAITTDQSVLAWIST